MAHHVYPHRSAPPLVTTLRPSLLLMLTTEVGNLTYRFSISKCPVFAIRCQLWDRWESNYVSKGVRFFYHICSLKFFKRYTTGTLEERECTVDFIHTIFGLSITLTNNKTGRKAGPKKPMKTKRTDKHTAELYILTS